MSVVEKPIVYWVVNGTYVTPKSPKFVNDVYSNYGYGTPTFAELAKSAFRRLLKDRKEGSCRYAVVTDAKGADERREIRNRFHSNSTVRIEGEYDAEKVRKQIEWVLSDFGASLPLPPNTWFTSDTHFNHANIIRYCGRPFADGADGDGNAVVSEKSVADMNETIIRRWNTVVGKDDVVWHLGDFCLGDKQRETIPQLVSRLNGRINLVLGNHDRHGVKFYYDAGFNRVYDHSVIIGGSVILSHVPIEGELGPFFNVAGHVHNSPVYKTFERNRCIVCVERHRYRPVSWSEIELTRKEMPYGED